MGDVVQIYEDYKDHADFLTVYVREAHPTDEWQMKSNLKDDVCYAQPKTLQQRVIIANDFTKRFKFPLPFGIDGPQQRRQLHHHPPRRVHLQNDADCAHKPSRVMIRP